MTASLQTGKLRPSHLWHEAPPLERGGKESLGSGKEQCPQPTAASAPE